jgi:hypothetical protein
MVENMCTSKIRVGFVLHDFGKYYVDLRLDKTIAVHFAFAFPWA